MKLLDRLWAPCGTEKRAVESGKQGEACTTSILTHFSATGCYPQ